MWLFKTMPVWRSFTFAHSRGTYTRTLFIHSVLINEMCLFEVSVRKANAEISAELTSHTSPFCNDYNKLQSFAFWSLCSFSHTPKTALSSFLLTLKFACF